MKVNMTSGINKKNFVDGLMFLVPVALGILVPAFPTLVILIILVIPTIPANRDLV